MVVGLVVMVNVVIDVLCGFLDPRHQSGVMRKKVARPARRAPWRKRGFWSRVLENRAAAGGGGVLLVILRSGRRRGLGSVAWTQ